MLRALVVSNMRPDEAHPERGQFVRDQVGALRRLPGVHVDLHELSPGASRLLSGALELRRRHGAPSVFSRRPAAPRYDVVHAHFGLTAWPALAVPARVRALTVHGTDLRQPRTRLATAAILPAIDLLAAASSQLVGEIPGARSRRRALVLPCGVDLDRFRPEARERARAELGLSADGRYLLLPSDPSRPEKRADRARAVAERCSAELLTLGGVDPGRVALWVNAADAVLVPSEREGFGLAVLEALACDVPVAATPVGIHAEALAGVEGALCAPFELDAWSLWARARLDTGGALAGRAAAERFSATAMAQRVLDAWSTAAARRT